jgi:hypothetical protein
LCLRVDKCPLFLEIQKIFAIKGIEGGGAGL